MIESGCRMLEVVVEITAEIAGLVSTSDEEIILYFAMSVVLFPNRK